ncbi:MAG: hypothetical protein ACK41T_01050 [Pseudobdellovibrio sp.]
MYHDYFSLFLNKNIPKIESLDEYLFLVNSDIEYLQAILVMSDDDLKNFLSENYQNQFNSRSELRQRYDFLKKLKATLFNELIKSINKGMLNGN